MGHGLFSLLYVHVEMILNGMMNEMDFFFSHSFVFRILSIVFIPWINMHAHHLTMQNHS